MFCLNRKHNLKRHNINYLDWPFLFKVNLKGSRYIENTNRHYMGQTAS